MHHCLIESRSISLSNWSNSQSFGTLGWFVGRAAKSGIISWILTIKNFFKKLCFCFFLISITEKFFYSRLN